MSDDMENGHEENGDVPEIELIIRVSSIEISKVFWGVTVVFDAKNCKIIRAFSDEEFHQGSPESQLNPQYRNRKDAN